MMEYTVQFLLMELESVGNIRLEEGCSTDAWYVLILLSSKLITTIIKVNIYRLQFNKLPLHPSLLYSSPNRFTSCCDLLHSRFSPPDFKVHSITGIKVNRIIRIHNSALRLRFEDKLHTLLASEESALSSQ